MEFEITGGSFSQRMIKIMTQLSSVCQSVSKSYLGTEKEDHVTHILTDIDDHTEGPTRSYHF